MKLMNYVTAWNGDGSPESAGCGCSPTGHKIGLQHCMMILHDQSQVSFAI